MDKYAYRATPQEIADNDFNLNIPRYVDTFEEEAEIDLDAVKDEITRLESELATVRAKMQAYLEELGCMNAAQRLAANRRTRFRLLIIRRCIVLQVTSAFQYESDGHVRL